MNHFTFSASLASVSAFFASLYFLFRPSKLDKIIAIYWFSIAFWAFTVGWQAWLLKQMSDYVWGWFLHLGCIIIPAIFFHSACILSGHNETKSVLIKVVYLISGIYIFLNTFTRFFTHQVSYRDLYAYPTPALLYPVYFVSFILMIMAGTFFLLFPKKNIGIGSKKWLYLFVLVHSLAYLGAMDNFFIMADIRIFPWYPYGLYPILLYALVGSFALTKVYQG